MAFFNSKELYMMNAGNLLYMYKDGFGDIYSATAAEEAEWAKQVINAALYKILVDENTTELQAAIDNLIFHRYPGLGILMLNKILGSSADRQFIFATELWKMGKSIENIDIIFDILLEQKAGFLPGLFCGLGDFKYNELARYFLFVCLQSNDDDLCVKAHTALSVWAFTGLPGLREAGLLDALQPENKRSPAYTFATERLREILQIIK